MSNLSKIPKRKTTENPNKVRSATVKLRQTKEKAKRFFGPEVIKQLSIASQKEKINERTKPRVKG